MASSDVLQSPLFLVDALSTLPQPLPHHQFQGACFIPTLLPILVLIAHHSEATEPRFRREDVDVDLGVEVVQCTGLCFGESTIFPQNSGVGLLAVDVAI